MCIVVARVEIRIRIVFRVTVRENIRKKYRRLLFRSERTVEERTVEPCAQLARLPCNIIVNSVVDRLTIEYVFANEFHSVSGTAGNGFSYLQNHPFDFFFPVAGVVVLLVRSEFENVAGL